MSKFRALIVSFWTSVVLFTAMSACFLLMPVVVSGANSTQTDVFTLGVIFWATAILGYSAVIIGSIVRKHICKEERIRSNHSPGAVSFLSNIPALIFDAGLLISIILLVVTLFTAMKETYFAYVVIASTVFFFHMHSLFNGKNYYIITRKHRKRGKHHGRFEK